MTLVAAAFMFLVSLTIGSAQLDPFATADIPFKVTPVDYVKSHLLQPNAVNGAKDCGGSGRVLQFVHNNCVSALPAVPCLGEISRPSEGAVYFVAGDDANEILVRASIISDGKVKSVNVPVPNTSIKIGQPYEVQVAGMFEPDLMGKVFTGRVEILKESDKSVQACSEIDFLGYKP